MSTSAKASKPEAHEETPASHEIAGIRPHGAHEFTLRALITGLVVAVIMGASYPYIVLKLGFGPNVSVVAAFFGYMALGVFFRSFNRWENNIVQTAGTSAAQTAFMCILLAAFDMLSATPGLGFKLVLSPMQSFAWLTTAGLLGVLLAVPMRQHFVVDEKLTYADGVAAAETLIVLDSRGEEAQGTARSMGIGTALSAFLMIVREDARVFSRVLLPEGWTFGKMHVGVSYSLLGLGSGMLVGMRINLSMLLGTILSWVVAPPILARFGLIPEVSKDMVLRWVMWPATGMLIAGGLTALVMRWRMLTQTFRNLTGASVKSDEFPLRWVGIGVAVTGVALVIVQKVSLDMPIWITCVAILLSLPLMLVGLRVLGETNWGPISALSNMMQAVFGLIAPGHVAANMAASGTTGTIATESEALMQDYKAGYMIGSSPRHMTYAQLLAVPVGALAVSYMYPLLRDTYGFDGPTGLSSPISRKWAGFAELLSRGLGGLPRGALLAMAGFVLVGIVGTILEQKSRKWRSRIPSPTGLGMGMLIPASIIITMFLGGVVEYVWRRRRPKQADTHLVPLASGFIAGEAIIAVLVPLLFVLGWLPLL